MTVWWGRHLLAKWALSNGDPPSPRQIPHIPPNMNPNDKIARMALAILRSGPVAPCIPGLAARRTVVAGPQTLFTGSERLTFESGGVPVVPPSARREVRI